jgi:hypothetical protein
MLKVIEVIERRGGQSLAKECTNYIKLNRVKLREASISRSELAFLMKQHALKNVNNCLSTNIYSYLEISGGQSYILYFNVVNSFNTSVN